VPLLRYKFTPIISIAAGPQLGIRLSSKDLCIDKCGDGSTETKRQIIKLKIMGGGLMPVLQQIYTLTPAQKLVVRKVANKIQDKLQNIDVSYSTLSYSLRKEAISHRSMSFGGQYRLNHNLLYRFETGFLGGCSSILVSTNHRFGF
jgi:hypothetical protein